MTQTQASEEERELFNRFQQDQPKLLDLAGLVAYVPRVEALLLRGVRLKFLPHLDALAEQRLWFSELVLTRNSSNFIFSPGMARLLTRRVKQNPERHDLQALKSECNLLTRHWPPLDRLERDLYFFALSGNEAGVAEVLQDTLRLISRYADNPVQQRAELLEVSRRIKYTSTIISDNALQSDNAKHLIHYAATSLHDPGSWSDRVDPVVIPDWLASTVSNETQNRLTAELRRDDETGSLVLYLFRPKSNEESMEFDGPLPARLHLTAPGFDPYWVLVNAESKIKLPATATRIELTTRRGKHYQLELMENGQPDTEHPDHPANGHKVYLAHTRDDLKQALAIQSWLKEQNVIADLIEESTEPPPLEQNAEQIRIMRLWTSSMQRIWQEWLQADASPGPGGLLLQMEDVPPPIGYATPAHVIDVRDWANDTDRRLAREVAQQIEHWVESPESRPEPSEDEYAEERQKLLDEIEDPDTKPERRLQIGDRLDEIGDTRPGVGVIEIELPGEITDQHAERSRLDELLDELKSPETQPKRRLEIGDELNDMPGGDPRFGVGLGRDKFPEIDWIKVAEGSFIYGEDSNKIEKSLPAFEIARYPVTNTQYQAFVDDGGYDDERWWQGLKKPEPEQPSWPQGNRPCTNVNWFETTAFARWLSWRLGQSITLPHEYQWERTARGKEGLAYPWGNEYQAGFANLNDSEMENGVFLEQTTAVGVFPQGGSQDGIADLSGNVWEWCRNDYDKPDDEIDILGEPVLRGGSWDFNPQNARAAYRRNGFNPVVHNNNFGIRLLRSPPS